MPDAPKPQLVVTRDESGYRQIPGFMQLEADHVDGMQPGDDFLVAIEDDDCDVLARRHIHEARDRADVLRLTIPEEMDRETALRLVRKLLAWMEKDTDILVPPAEECAFCPT